jgi:putative ABC transport system permease protein
MSAIIPARRAVRIPPVAALVEQRADGGERLPRRRVIGGVAAALAGIVAVLAGLTSARIALVGVGAAAEFVAAGMLVPLLARPVSSALGRPLAAILGPPGKLGRENSMRNPLRTAQTAAALMIGLALVSTIAVLGSSLSTSAKDSVDSAMIAGYIIGGSDSISTSVSPLVARLPGVTATTVVYTGQFDFRGSLSSIGGVSTVGLKRTVNLHIVAGRGAAAMAAGELLTDTNTANTKHLHVGSVVNVTFAQTGATRMRIGGIYKYNPLVGSFLTGAGFFVSHFNHPLVDAVLVSTARGTPHFEQTLNRALNAYANLSIKSRAQFEQSQQATITQLLGLVYVLLALAVMIALIGIVNTLMLSVFERTREIGLLRAVGMKRRQVRAMIRSEAVIIALFGAMIGIVIGAALGTALASSLRNSGVTTISVPVGSLIAFLVLSALLGLGAATWPARRAANLDVLAAIATE